jgi:hypothetical protein
MVIRNGDDAASGIFQNSVTDTESKEAIVKLDSSGSNWLPDQSNLVLLLLNTVMMKMSNYRRDSFGQDGSNYLKIDELDKNMALLLKSPI